MYSHGAHSREPVGSQVALLRNRRHSFSRDSAAIRKQGQPTRSTSTNENDGEGQNDEGVPRWSRIGTTENPTAAGFFDLMEAV